MIELLSVMTAVGKRPIEELRELIALVGMKNVAARCRETSASYVYRVAKGKGKDGTNPTLDKIQDIVENGCGMPLAEFFGKISPVAGADQELWEKVKSALLDDRRAAVAAFLSTLDEQRESRKKSNPSALD